MALTLTDQEAIELENYIQDKLPTRLGGPLINFLASIANKQAVVTSEPVTEESTISEQP